jgi:hypothetical protein
LSIHFIPTPPALRPQAVTAWPEIDLASSAHTNLASPERRAGARVLVPPPIVDRQSGHLVLKAEAASDVVERPAVLLAYDEAATWAGERYPSPEPALAKAAPLHAHPCETYEYARHSGSGQRSEPRKPFQPEIAKHCDSYPQQTGDAGGADQQPCRTLVQIKPSRERNHEQTQGNGCD